MNDPKIVTCECGAKVRLPADSEGRAVRCPKCKSAIALTISARVLESTRLQPGDPGAKCPICQGQVGTDDLIVSCPQCQQVHHRECWTEMGGCSTYGCTEAPAIDKSNAVAAQPLTGWGDDKKCPACGETIKSIAVRCRYCETDFGTVDPMTLRDLRRQSTNEDALKRLRQGAVALFVVSLLGCLAPITGLVGALLFLPKRKELKKCGPLYQVMVYAALGLSAVYCVLIVLFVVYEVFK